MSHTQSKRDLCLKSHENTHSISRYSSNSYIAYIGFLISYQVVLIGYGPETLSRFFVFLLPLLSSLVSFALSLALLQVIDERRRDALGRYVADYDSSLVDVRIDRSSSIDPSSPSAAEALEAAVSSAAAAALATLDAAAAEAARSSDALAAARSAIIEVMRSSDTVAPACK